MINKRIRILQLQPECHDRSHDPTDLAEQIVSAFPRETYETTSAFLRGLPAPDQPQSGAEHVHYFDLPGKALRGLRIQLHRTLWRYCTANRFDVVICNRYKPVSAMLALNHWLQIPVCIGISHGIGEYDRLWRRRFVSALLTPSWKFVGVSSAVRDHLICLECGFTAGNTVAITNALDINLVESMQLPRASARLELGLPQDVRLIGAIGRLVPVKGHIHLLRAFASIANNYRDVHLAIIGEGSEEARLRATASDLGVADRLHLLGWRTRARRYVKAFDIWTMPSLREGLGLALLEGMAGHLPIIASDIPAMRPLIDGAGGLAVPPGKESELAQAMAKYLELSCGELSNLGEKAFRYVQRCHNVADYRFAYRQLVEQALKDRLA